MTGQEIAMVVATLCLGVVLYKIYKLPKEKGKEQR